MSEFDKEAEREKLREKYERDKQKRKSTQRMSELLLKGATMTNRHCDDCGDPIFRYDGQEFCPTCQQSAQTAPGENQPPETALDDDARASSEQPPSAAADGQSPPTADPENAAGDRTDAGTESDLTVESVDRAAADRQSDQPDQPTHRTDVGTDRDGDLEDARASLVRSLERYARAAEGTDDPRRAKERLAAAREAARALSALDR